MRVLVTGSAGRLGRTIYKELMTNHEVIGFDKTPCPTADFIGDIGDDDLVTKALEGIDVIVHTAALHSPHVGSFSDNEFLAVNVNATEKLALTAIKRGIKHFVFTSTTALYGYASTPKGETGWINERVKPKPRTIYHRSKILAENKLQEISNLFNFPVTVLQISRCFPEPADLMAVYRLSRGIDARDVANAHLCAIDKRLGGFNRYIISGSTPFSPSDCQTLYRDATAALKVKCPELVMAFKQRGWSLPATLDRVYDSSAAQDKLGWLPSYSFQSVLNMLDDDSTEVLPATKPK